MNIIGYADPVSVAPGGNVEFKLSTTEQAFSASLVRLTGGPGKDTDSIKVPVDFPGLGSFPGRRQTTQIGSHADFALPADLSRPETLGIRFWLNPSQVTLDRPQTVLDTNAGLRVVLSAGHLSVSVGNANCTTAAKLENGIWYAAVVVWTATRVTLSIKRISGWAERRVEETVGCGVGAGPATGLAAIRLAASLGAPAADHYNGKIEGLCLRAGENEDAPIVACWAFDREIGSDVVVDIGPHELHGKLVNMPTRAVTGHNWTGDVFNYAQAPDQYGAIAFHDDDLYDSGWETDVKLAIPGDFPSGVYALQVSAGGTTDSIPFFVRGGAEGGNDVLFLAPTNTYLAYGNENLAKLDLSTVMQHDLVLSDADHFILNNPFIGKSQYDLHNDGSPIVYSSRLRPVLNFRPDYRTWLNDGPRHFAADLLVVGWLETRGTAYDVAIDEDLDREGLALLQRYKVLVTGTHPEYWSASALRALHAWLAEGGRMIYLGANGFYWVTGLTPGRGDATEVRRGNAATRTADTPAGEGYLVTTGELGGIWRHRGFSPQALTGVGFAAQGWGGACGYKRLKGSYEGPGAAFFEGIDSDVIGEFGIMGGAAGDEVDRLDYNFGTPSHAIWLATSTGLSNYYQLVHEDLLFTLPGSGGAENPLVRGDIVTFDIEGGGKVFSVGSINFAGAMAWNGYDNDVAKLADNAMRLFLKSE